MVLKLGPREANQNTGFYKFYIGAQFNERV